MGGLLQRLLGVGWLRARPLQTLRRSRRDRQPTVSALEDRRLLSLNPTKTIATATPRYLQPPNGEYLPVTVTGSFQEAGQQATPTGFFYVTDQYGMDEPFGDLKLTRSTADPKVWDFAFTINLRAKFGSMTYNGRQYDILVGAKDGTGTVGKTIAVNVPKTPVHPNASAAIHISSAHVVRHGSS